MKANIEGENEGGIGLYVVDNAAAEHAIEMDYQGEILYHDQDGYPDHPDDRTDAERKAVMQAREFARYYVYRERGYETLPPHENPDRLTLATLIVASLSTAEFERHFGDLYRQCRSETTPEDPVVELPDGLSKDDYYLYAKELYLGLEREDVASVLSKLDERHVESLTALTADVADQADVGLASIDALPPASDLGAKWLEAVSDVLVQWRIGESIHRQNSDLDRDRDPDIVVEVHSYEPDSIDAFQEYLVYHLRCQIRDAYLQTGQTPPENARVQGPGQDMFTMMYQTVDSFQSYHDPNATIDWTADCKPPTPE